MAVSALVVWDASGFSINEWSCGMQTAGIVDILCAEVLMRDVSYLCRHTHVCVYKYIVPDKGLSLICKEPTSFHNFCPVESEVKHLAIFATEKFFDAVRTHKC